MTSFEFPEDLSKEIVDIVGNFKVEKHDYMFIFTFSHITIDKLIKFYDFICTRFVATIEIKTNCDKTLSYHDYCVSKIK